MDDGEDLIGTLEVRLGLLSRQGEFLGAVKVTVVEELLGDSEQPLGLDSARMAVHFCPGRKNERGRAEEGTVWAETQKIWGKSTF